MFSRQKQKYINGCDPRGRIRAAMAMRFNQDLSGRGFSQGEGAAA
jgi:hypothetical protein